MIHLCVTPVQCFVVLIVTPIRCTVNTFLKLFLNIFQKRLKMCKFQ
nr:MAG TPA: hypothetical protein [Caudoviricetes sp.]